MSYNKGEIKVQSTAKKKTINSPWSKDAIMDPAGQWKYPGQVTKVPSGHITMQGVPYPVMGVDEYGNQQLMTPGGGIQATHQMPDGSWMPGATHGEYEDVELSDEEIEEYRRGGCVVEELPKAQDGLSTSVNTPGYKYDPNPVFRQSHPSGVSLPTPTQAYTNQGALRKTVRQPILDKTYDVLSNPMTAIANARGGIPDNIGAAVQAGSLERSPLDIGVDVINPAFYVNTLGQAGTDLSEGNYGDALLNAAMVVPALSELKGVNVTKHLKPVARTLRDMKDYGASTYVHPITKRKTIKQLKELNKGLVERYSTPEMKRRLSTIGVKPEDLTIPNLSFIGGEQSHYNAAFNNLNMDLSQTSRLRKQGRLTNSDIATYEHEVGHWLQKEGAKHSPAYKQRLEKYNFEKANWDAKQKRLAESRANIGDYATDSPVLPPESLIERTVHDNLLTRKPLTDLPGSQPGQIPPYEAVNGTNPSLTKAYDNWDYFHYKHEPLAHAREMRHTMIEKGYLKNLEDKITDTGLMKFIEENPTDRISSFIAKTPDAVRRLKQVLNNAPAVAPVIGTGVGAAALSQQRLGGSTSNYENKELSDREIAEYRAQGYTVDVGI
jgi:hypothetical protein